MDKDTYMSGLNAELEFCKQTGRTERVKAIEAELKRVRSGGRETAVAPAPETA